MVVVLPVGCGSAGPCPAGQLRKRRAGASGTPGRRVTGVTSRVRGVAHRQLRTVLEGGGVFEGPRWHDGSVRRGAQRQGRTGLEGGGFFEGPRWHDGSWWVSDFYRHTVSRVTPEGAETVVVEVEGQPSGLGWLPDEIGGAAWRESV